MPAYDYQLIQVEETIDALSKHRKVLMQLPTGGGKTYEFALITQRYVRNEEKAVLILVHREELMYQTQRAIKNICNIDSFLITKETKRFSINRVYIGMVESTMSRLHMFHNVGLVIADECHIANFNKIHSIFIEEKILGVTATNLSSNKNFPLNKFYYRIVTGPQIKELISLGNLSQNVTRCPSDIVDFTKLQVDKKKGDYDEVQMSYEFSKTKFVTNVIKEYDRWCNGEKTVVFNVSKTHSKSVNECFVTCGFNSRHLDSDSSLRPSSDPRYKNEREEILAWFKETEGAILNNVMIATVGWDEPTVRNVILNFSTLSLCKFIQTSGRASRVISEELAILLGCKPKHMFNIIDLGGNWSRFGDWNDDRDWRGIFDNPPKVSHGIAPVKTCPKCEGLVHASASYCPLTDEDGEWCQYEFIRKKSPEEQDIEEMILVTKNINIDDLVDKGKKKYEYFTFLELGADVVKNMYEIHENPSLTIKQRYFDIYYNLCIEWYNKTLAGKDGYINDITTSAWHIRRALNNFNNLVRKTDGVTIQLKEDYVLER